MYLWNVKGIPHKGWTCVRMIDLGEGAGDMDLGTRKAELYEQCEMCGHEGIRYVHIMEHPDYEGQLRVGCICAEKMENDYRAPRKREDDLRNRYKRKMNFLKREWDYRANGNMVLKYKGQYITIMPSKFNRCCYGVIYNRNSVWAYKGKKIVSIEAAKLAAFDIFDK